jgi:predicted dehydrogenase
VQRALVEQRAVFGDFRIDGDQPAIAIRSVHHLCKRVNNEPLRRPPWYFDPAVQGEGISDVTTHLVDLVQWMTGNGVRFDFDRHVERLSARQWPTAVPREVFARITGLEDFPAALHHRVTDGALQFLCNAALSYRLRGVPVEIESLWGLEEPEGSGDLHRAILRGTKSDLIVDQGPDTRFLSRLTINPVEDGKAFAEALNDAVARMQTEFPGLGVEPAGAEFRIKIPKALRTTHEQHFAAVLQTFLTHIDEGTLPENLSADLDTKYTLLARALELSHAGRVG